MTTIRWPTLAATGLVVGVLLGGTPPAAATATGSCEARFEQLRQRLEQRIEPSFMKERYASALNGAFERCRAGDRTAWKQIESVLS